MDETISSHVINM